MLHRKLRWHEAGGSWGFGSYSMGVGATAGCGGRGARPIALDKELDGGSFAGGWVAIPAPAPQLPALLSSQAEARSRCPQCPPTPPNPTTSWELSPFPASLWCPGLLALAASAPPMHVMQAEQTSERGGRQTRQRRAFAFTLEEQRGSSKPGAGTGSHPRTLGEAGMDAHSQ